MAALSRFSQRPAEKLEKGKTASVGEKRRYVPQAQGGMGMVLMSRAEAGRKF